MNKLYNIFISGLLFSTCQLKTVVKYDPISMDKIFQKDCLALSFLQRVSSKRKNSDSEPLKQRDIKRGKYLSEAKGQSGVVNSRKRKISDVDSSDEETLNLEKSELNTAIDDGDIKKCRILLEEEGEDCTNEDEKGNTSLHYACLSSSPQIEIVELLVQCGAKWNVLNHKNKSPLNLAMDKNQEDLIEKILKKIDFFDINMTIYEQNKNTFLHYACLHSSFNIVKLLIDHGANLNIKNSEGETPFHFACYRDSLNVEIVQLLIDHGAKVAMEDAEGFCVLDNVIFYCEFFEAKQIIEKLSESFINRQDRHGRTFLHYACLYGRVDILKILIQCGADTGIQDRIKQTSLHLAMMNMNINILREILTVNESLINKQDWAGYTVLHNLCRTTSSTDEESLLCLKLLLKYGANLNITNKRGQTPLHLVVRNGNLNLVKAFLDANAGCINTVDCENSTALHYFCAKSDNANMDILDVLIASHARWDILSDRNELPLEVPLFKSKIAFVAKILQKLKSSTIYEAVDNKKEGPSLHHLCLNRKVAIVEELLKCGLDVNMKNNEGQTALSRVCNHCSPYVEMLNVLIDHGAKVDIQNDDGHFVLLKPIFDLPISEAEQIIKRLKPSFINRKNRNGMTFLHHACLTKKYEIVQILLKYGADPRIKNKNGQTVLHLALIKKDINIVEKLLNVDYNYINYEDKEGETALHYLCSGDCPQIDFLKWLKLLIDHGAKMDLKNKKGQTVLHLVLIKKDINRLEELLNVDCSYINDKDNHGASVLHYLCRINYKDEDNAKRLPNLCCKYSKKINILKWLKLLIDHGANVDLENNKGELPLHLAVIAKHIGLVRELLLINHSSIDHKDKEGQTALHLHCLQEDYHDIDFYMNFFRLLITFKADWGIASDFDGFPLDIILKRQKNSIIEKILKQIDLPKLDIKHKNGNTYLHYVCLFHDIAILRLFLKQTWNVDVTNKEGNTPLHIVCSKGDIRMIKLLLKYHARCDIKNKEGESPFDVIVKIASNNDGDQEKKIQIFELFLQHENSLVIKQKWLSSLLYNKEIKLQNSAFGKYLQDLENTFVRLKNAILTDDIDTIKTLFQDNKALVYMRDENNKTLLHMACENRSFKVVQCLVEYGLDVDSKDKYNKTPLWYSWFCSKSIDISHCLINKGANPFIKNAEDCTMINDVLSHERGYINNKMNELIGYFKNIKNIITKFKESCQNKEFVLAKQIFLSNRKVIEFDFMQNSFNILKQSLKDKKNEKIQFIFNNFCIKKILNEKDENGKTLLHLFCNEKESIFVQTLLQVGADVNKEDNFGNTSLHIAASSGNIEIVPYLSGDIDKIDMKNHKGETPLFCACVNKNLEMVRCLQGLGADLNTENEKGESLLQVAFVNEDTDMLDYLVREQKMDINKQDNKGESLIFYYCFKKNLEMVRYLQGLGADLNTENEKGESLLSVAFGHEDLAMIKYLIIEQKMDINKKDNKGQSLIFDYCFKKNLKMVRCLQEVGVDLNTENDKGESLLSVAAVNVDSAMMRYLIIEQKMDINKKNNKGESLIFYYCFNKNLEMVRYLRGLGADLNIENEKGESLLSVAAVNVDSAMMKYLIIEQKIDINTKDNKGQSLIFDYCFKKNLEMVRCLKRVGADLNTKNEKGESLLSVAAVNADLAMAKYLIKYGANIDSKDNKGQSILHSVCVKGDLAMAQYLIEHGANINSKDNKGQSIFHSVGVKGNLAMAQYLINHGANNTKDNKGQSILYSVCVKGDLAMAKYLVDHGANINMRDNNKESILHFLCVNINNNNGQSILKCICENEDLEIVQDSMTDGVDINIRDKDGQKKINCVCGNKDLNMIQDLIDQDVNMDVRDKNGQSILACVYANGKLEMAEYLIDHGADINIRDEDGRTPLHTFCAKGDLNMVQYLIDHGASIDMRDNKRHSILDCVVARGYIEILKCFLEKRECPLETIASQESKGKYLMQMACKYGDVEVLKKLVEKWGCSIEMNEDQGEKGEYLMQMAYDCEQMEVVQYFIDKGYCSTRC